MGSRPVHKGRALATGYRIARGSESYRPGECGGRPGHGRTSLTGFHVGKKKDLRFKIHM